MSIIDWFCELFDIERPKTDRLVDYGDGVIINYTKDGEIIFKNNNHNIEMLIKDKYDNLHNIHDEDIDFSRVDLLENPHNAHHRSTRYGFSIGRFEDGVAQLCWTLYPDGRYFADSDGFGGEDCNETTIYAYIDTLGKIIIPFRDMTYEERKEFESIAKYKVRRNNFNK